MTVTPLSRKVKAQEEKENLIRPERRLRNLYGVWTATDKVLNLKLGVCKENLITFHLSSEEIRPAMPPAHPPPAPPAGGRGEGKEGSPSASPLSRGERVGVQGNPEPHGRKGRAAAEAWKTVDQVLGAARFAERRSAAVSSAGRSVRSAMSAKPMISAVSTPTCAVGTNGEKTNIRKPATRHDRRGEQGQAGRVEGVAHRFVRDSGRIRAARGGTC